MMRLVLLVLCGLSAWIARAETLVEADAVWKFFKGRSEASTPDVAAWRGVAFDDSGWESGAAPFFYENEPASTTAYNGLTPLTDMVGNYSCVFLRREFTVEDPSQLAGLRFLALSDDGFIVWLNGVEIGRFNMPVGAVAFDGASLPALSEPVPVADFPVSDPAAVLRPGTNVLAVQAFNSSVGSSGDFYFVGLLAAPSSGPWSQVGISEFMATNRTTVADVDGDFSGWIELHNPTDVPVSLSGWSLTTDANQLRQWMFPAITLPARDQIVVFTSGKNRAVATNELHTNFRLPVAGGFLALVGPATNIVSAFVDYPAQTADVSYGRDPFLVDEVGAFTKPTPADPNTTGGAGVAPDVGFSREGGLFVSPFNLVLSTGTNAVIRYTLDGSLPTEDSPRYAGPIPVSATTRVRARAFQPGLRPGALQSESYLQLDSQLVSTTSDLPAIVLYNHGAGGVPTDFFQNVDVAIVEPVGGLTRLTNTASLTSRAGIHLRGSSTLFFPKNSFSLEFRDEADDDKDRSPLGLPEDSDWVLYAPNDFDRVLLHNPLIYSLSLDVGRYAPRTRFVEVYLNTWGGPIGAQDYQGIYVLAEKIKWGGDRVDVAKIRSIHKLHPSDNSGTHLTGGYLMKIDRTGPGETGFFGANQQIIYNYPDEAEIKTPQRLPQKQYLSAYMNAFGQALNGANFADPINGFRAFVDVPSWIDSHILNTVAFNVDALRLSAYFFKDRNGRLQFGPIWDFDRSQGSADGRDFNPRRWQSTQGDLGTDFFNYTWWNRMFRDLEFWQAWIDRYQELREGVFSTNHLFGRIDELANQVRRQHPLESERWFGLTAPRSGQVRIDGYAHTFPGTYQGEVDFLKKWYHDRLQFMDTNFVAKPIFSRKAGGYPPGEALAITGPAGGTIYWTTNGVDPRLPGGGISPDARTYIDPIPLSPNLRVRSRVMNPVHRNQTGASRPPLNSTWSGMTDATYFPATTPVLSGGFAAMDAYLGQTPKLTFAIQGDPAPQLQWWFNGQPIVGQTNAALPLTLTQTNQSGRYTLTATNAAGGAAAAIELAVTPKPRLAITEAQSSESRGSVGSTLDHQDWWELTNLGDFPVNLQGFRFNDDHRTLTNAWVITNAVVVAPGESVVLVLDMAPEAFRTWWGATNLPPALQILTYADIGFGADGDAIHLWNAAASSEADSVTNVVLGAASRGVTFGYDFATKTFGGLSVAGVGGAFAAKVNGDIGSPGTILSPVRLTGSVGSGLGEMQLGFNTRPGWQYEVFYKGTLLDSVWMPLTNFVAPADRFLFKEPVNGQSAQRVYRVRVSP